MFPGTGRDMHRWKPYHNDQMFWTMAALAVVAGFFNPANWIE